MGLSTGLQSSTWRRRGRSTSTDCFRRLQVTWRSYKSRDNLINQSIRVALVAELLQSWTVITAVTWCGVKSRDTVPSHVTVFDHRLDQQQQQHHDESRQSAAAPRTRTEKNRRRRWSALLTPTTKFHRHDCTKRLVPQSNAEIHVALSNFIRKNMHDIWSRRTRSSYLTQRTLSCVQQVWRKCELLSCVPGNVGCSACSGVTGHRRYLEYGWPRNAWPVSGCSVDERWDSCGGSSLSALVMMSSSAESLANSTVKMNVGWRRFDDGGGVTATSCWHRLPPCQLQRHWPPDDGWSTQSLLADWPAGAMTAYHWNSPTDIL